MGINDLQLSSELIAVLYPESLIQAHEPLIVKENVSKIKAVAETLQPIETNHYPFMGENRRSVCFLTNYPEEEFLPAGQLRFLQKILAACKYDLNDIALVNIANVAFDLAELRIRLNPKIIFLWGVLPAQAGLKSELTAFHETRIDGISVIPLSNPDLMSGDHPEANELKQRLWACLKKLFNL